jgi:hypothetical protein
MVKMSDYFAFLCRLPDLKISISHVRFSLIAELQLQEHAGWLRKAGMTPANPIRYIPYLMARLPSNRRLYP